MSYQNGGGGADSGPPEDVTAAGPPSAALALNAGQHQPEDESRSRSRPNSHVHYAPTIDPGLAGTARPVLATELAKPALARSDTEAALSPSVRRRLTRAGTFKTVDDFEEFTIRPGWHPGAEPGVDPTKPDGGHASMPTLSAPCEITVVDFSQDNLSIQKFDNETLPSFMNRPQPGWVKCRWVNVNGLSWDVIKVIGRRKNLHKLAVEDLMNTRNRTKVEWFPTHAFIILTLQKLVHLYDSDSEDSDSGDDDRSQKSGASKLSTRSSRRLFRRLRRTFRAPTRDELEQDLGAGRASIPVDFGGYVGSQPTSFARIPQISQLRTLQRYHGSRDDPRIQYMEKHSSLASKKLAVACEQVSLFITNDNTIISFFEQSAQDVEAPIVRRLQTNDTIIRQSCDASMVGQAILDAIIDLAIPVAACYGDVIGDLELDVLNRPNIGHTKRLYILIAEINKILAFINPITSLINALRDHKADVAQDAIMAHLLDPKQGVIITPLTYTYLGDVLDHCVLITETLNQLKGSADGMIGLIFNTISAYQNESMKQLTIATIIFLPLTFLTGYFGQNFQPFTVLQEDVGYFWKIAIPVVIFTTIILLREVIYDYCKALLQRRYILRLKKSRSRRRDKKRL
ncbi:737d3a48-7b95-4302-b682-bdd258f802ba [Thermothielavioides terrestris]|nr:737d3a48-7b95-4302-b682-bdd258f802ba [Thermothielavioides terrestris]